MREILLSGAKRLGLALEDSALGQFENYARILEEENRKINLTAVTGEREIAERHFIDSLAVLAAAGDIVKCARVVDVGSGAGFPGLPMKIAEPSICLTALDSTEKKVQFLRKVCEVLGLSGAEAVFGRAEELSRLPERREKYDIAVSRAVARLNVLAELCLPFVKVGGSFFAMKTASNEEEIKEAANAVKLLGGEMAGQFDYEIMGASHRIVCIRKVKSTPEKYPRRFAKIQKQPL